MQEQQDSCACISPFSGINCTRLYNNHLPECFHILSGQFPVSHGIVFRIRRLFPDLVRVAAGIHFGSGPFPAPVHAFFYFRYGLVRSLCWGFQIPQYMGKAFLMICSIIIKSNIVIVHKDPLIILSDRPFYPFMPFFLTGKVQDFSIRYCTDVYMTAFSVSFAFVQSVCMTGESSISAYVALRSGTVFKANSLLSLLIIPLEIFSFPPVRSDRNFLLLSIETQQSLFRRNRNARILPS